MTIRRLWPLLCLLIGFGLLATNTSAQGAPESRIVVLEAKGVVNPVMSSYFARELRLAQESRAQAVLVKMDTPGGLDTSMREMIQAILDSDTPVIIYVTPPGGRAASAGLFLAMAAHVSAMAPNTNIGSAHPVNLGGDSAGGEDSTMTEKVVNDSVALIRGLAARYGRNPDWAEDAVRKSVNVTAEEAVRLKVVDLMADNDQALLSAIDGREIKLARGTKKLDTASAWLDFRPPGAIERFLGVISDPNFAYILLTVGVYGLIYELASPGAVVPGVAGVLALVLAFYSLGQLPINYAGLGLILFGFTLLAAEVLVAPGIGALAFGGLLSLGLGSILLLEGAPAYATLSIWVIAIVVGTTGAFFLIAIQGIARSYRRKPLLGQRAAIGKLAAVRTSLAPAGMVFLDGELWSARLEDRLATGVERGRQVRVVGLDGLTLVVTPGPTEPRTPNEVNSQPDAGSRGQGA